MMKRLALLFFAITTLSHVSFGQQFKYWKQLNGPSGGYVFSTAVDSTQRVLIGTGAGGIYTSSNNGDTWTPLNKGLRTLRIQRLEAGPAQYIYMFDLNYEFARFRDLDIGWEFFIPWEDQSIASRINDLHVTPQGTLYLCGHRQGIRRSTDDGATWHWPEWFTADSTRKKLSFRRLASTITGDTIYGITDTGYVYRTTGTGDTWEKADGQLPNWKVITESFEVSRGGDLVVGTQRDTVSGKIYRSTNGGGTWEFVFEFKPLDHVAYALVRSNANGDLYASTHSPPDSREQSRIGGIYYSTTNGATWELRDDAEHGDDKFSMTVNREGKIFHGSVPGGVEMSTDRGFTWTDKNDGLYAQFLLGTAVSSQGDLFAITPFTTYRSSGEGSQWQELATEQIESFHEPIIRVLPGDILYQGTFYGLYRSADNGDHWTRVLEGDSTDPNNYFYDVQQSPSGSIYASSEKTGLMVSKDNGFNWQKVPNLDEELDIPSFTFAGPDSVLLSTESNTCLLSTNGGINWLSRENFLNAAKLLFHHNGTFVALQAHTVRKSTDGGNNWSEPPIFPTPELKAVKENWDLFSMFMDRNKNILVGSDSGVWMSAPPYTEWVQRGFGMTSPDYRIDHYAIASQIVQHPGTGVLYASTRGQSMFRSTFADLGVKLPASVAISGGQNYPNPFTDATSIEIVIATGGYAEFEVYTALGERVLHERKGHVSAGLVTVGFTGSQLASGSYLYLLRLEGKPIARGWMQIVR